MDQNDAKRAAARAAIAELPEHGVIGLGTGSTSKFFIEEVAALVKAGRMLRGVPTSEASREQALSLGIPLLSDDTPWEIDVTVDGADEVDPVLDLIKGGGGAHTREKMVNHASKKNVIVADSTKLVPRLGTRWAVPVEVLRFGHTSTARHLGAHGRATLRLRDGSPWVTDSGNYIYDVASGPIADSGVLELALKAIPGVVETGLFVRRADVVLLADAIGIRRLTRTAAV